MDSNSWEFDDIPAFADALEAMRIPSFKIIHWIIMTAMALVLLPLGHALYLAQLYVASLSHSSQVAIERRLDSTLQAVSERVERVRALLESLALSDHAQQGNWRGLYELSRRIVQNQHLLRSIALVDADGYIVFSSIVPFGSEHPLAGHPEEARQVMRTGQPVLSGPFVSQLKGAADPQPPWLVAIGIPVVRDGKVTAVLRGVVPCGGLRDLLTDLKFPEGWLATITDRDGMLIARTLSHEETVGKQVNPPMAEAIRGHRRGIDISHPLVKAARTILAKLEIQPEIYATTSMMAALRDAGIPCVTIGVTTGERKNELDEIDESADILPMSVGLAQLAALVQAMDGGLS